MTLKDQCYGVGSALDGKVIDWEHVEAILVDSSEAEPAAKGPMRLRLKKADEALMSF